MGGGGEALEPSKGPVGEAVSFASIRDTPNGIDARHTIKHVIRLIFYGAEERKVYLASKVVRRRLLCKLSAMRGLRRAHPA